MRIRSKAFGLAFAAAGLALLASGEAKADVTKGIPIEGNCYPFNCNDSGSNTGQTIFYQQVYSGAVLGALTFDKISFERYADSRSAYVLRGSYDISFGTIEQPPDSPAPLTLSNLQSFASFVVSTAIPVTSSWSISGAPYTFLPTSGDLVMQVVATGQDPVPAGSEGGYFAADPGVDIIWRNFQTSAGSPWSGQQSGALVTTFSSETFSGGNPLPAPGPVAGTGWPVLLALFGLGAFRRRYALVAVRRR